jgi:hypothetical protein
MIRPRPLPAPEQALDARPFEVATNCAGSPRSGTESDVHAVDIAMTVAAPALAQIGGHLERNGS